MTRIEQHFAHALLALSAVTLMTSCWKHQSHVNSQSTSGSQSTKRVPKGVYFGKPIAWRPLASLSGKADAASARMLVSNFTGKGEESILIAQTAQSDQTSLVIDPSTDTKRSVGIRIPVECDAVAWDYDGDGISEIVEYASGGPDRILYLQGSMKGSIDSPFSGRVLDWYGDGHEELFLPLSDSSARILGTKGKLLDSLKYDGSVVGVGHVGHDSRAALFIWKHDAADAKGRFATQEVDKAAEHDWPALSPYKIIDVNGDGVDDLLSSEGSYVDCATSTFHDSNIPDEYSSSGRKALAAPFDLGGRHVLAISPNGDDRNHSLVVIDTVGSLVYGEVFDTEVLQLETVHVGKRAVLVALLTDRVIASPEVPEAGK